MKTIAKLMCVGLVALLLATPQSAEATHAVAADIQVIQLGPLQYRVVLRLYRDCIGISAPLDADIMYTSAVMGLSGMVTAFPVATLPNGNPNGSQIPLSPCIQPGVLTTCQGGTAYGVQEWHYEAIITLPMACPDWTFSYELCCRNNTVDNISTPGNTWIYVFTQVDNVNIVTNNSPVFNTIPVNQFCVGNQFFYSQGAVDPDGDSLVYSLVTCLGANGTQVQYTGNFSSTQPITSANGVTIDPHTGLISFLPTMQMEAILCVLVDEYRNGVWIGSVQRDIQISISGNCVPNMPVTVKDTVNAIGQEGILAYCGDQCVVVALTENVQCGSVALDGSDFRALDPLGYPNPVFDIQPMNCTNGFTDSLLVCFHKPLIAGTTILWTKIGNDGNTLLSDCGTPMNEFDTLNIFVMDTITEKLVPDQVSVGCSFNHFSIELNQNLACNTFATDASDFTLIDASGTIIPLADVRGVGCAPASPYVNEFEFSLTTLLPQIQNPMYLILGSGTDNNTVANQCMVFLPIGDTLAILNSTGVLNVDLGTDITLCSNDPLPSLDAGLTGATYQWYLDGNPLPNTTQSITANQSGNYTVIATAHPGCEGSDTVYVNIVQAPKPDLGADVNVCHGDQLPVFDGSIGGAINYIWTLNGDTVAINTPTFQPTVAGTYILHVDVGGQCIGIDTVALGIEPEVDVDLGNDLSICEDKSHTLNAGIIGASNYAWTLNGNAIAGNTQTIDVSEAGIYACEVTSLIGCKGSGQMTLTVERYPAPPQVLCETGNSGEFVYKWLPLTGVVSYEVSIDGGLTWQSANLLAGPFSHQISDAANLFLVRGVSSGMCNPGRVSEPAPCEVYIPNIITPNDDLINDIFVISNIEQYPKSMLKIYNRWGNIILEKTGYNNDWSARDVPDGTYFYTLQLTANDQRTGTLTILR